MEMEFQWSTYLESVPDKSEVETLLQVVIYWENDIEYRVDFHYCDFRKNR